jgi:hypothetical protein
MNRRQFEDFSSRMESEYIGVLYCTEYSCSSLDGMHKGVFRLKSGIGLFLKVKGKPFPRFYDHD